MNNLITTAAALSAGIAGGCFLLLLLSLLGEMRMDRGAAKTTEAGVPLFFRILLLFTPNVRRLSSADSLRANRDRAEEMLGMAGLEQNLNGEQFTGIQILCAGIGGVLAFLFMGAGQGIAGLLIFLLLFLFPKLWLKAVVSRRHLSIMKALPNLLDLLTLSVEAGKDFLSALRDILAKRPPDVLSAEFLRVLHEIQLGKNRQTALREMSQRNRQPELTSVIGSIIQADEMGVSIGQLLKIQSDQLRMKRFALAEKLANEAPVKILLPVVVFIFPAVLLLLMTPILLQAFSMLGK